MRGCRGEVLTASAFVTFQRIWALPLTAAEMGLDWELGVNYVQNIEITIELSQFQPLFCPIMAGIMGTLNSGLVILT